VGRGRFAQWLVAPRAPIELRVPHRAGVRRVVASSQDDDDDLLFKPSRVPINERGSSPLASARPVRADGCAPAARRLRRFFGPTSARSCHPITHAEGPRRRRSRDKGRESLLTSRGRASHERRARTVVAMTMAPTHFGANMTREFVGPQGEHQGGTIFRATAPGAGRFTFRRSENGARRYGR
jgi:hypothetical protein